MKTEALPDNMTRTDLSGLKVLVVDDQPAAAQTLAWALELLGPEVKTCADGLQALEIAAEFDPDIVLLDIGLPGMNGYEVCRRLRSDSRTRSEIIVAQTGRSQSEFVKRSFEAGFDYHLVKPVDIGALREILIRLITKQEVDPPFGSS